MRIALLSNVTLGVLAGLLGKEHDLWLPTGFGAWMETALDIPRDLRAFDPEAVFLILDSSHIPCNPAAVEIAVAALESALPKTTVIVPDLEDLAAELLPRPFFDERMWRVGSMPWSMEGLRVLRNEIDRLLGAMRGERRKVLALDFDNTLWTGVIGEEGVKGIVPRAAFQREILALRERGVLLVGLSKNNVADVEPIWDDPRMVLGKDDFVDLRIDWKNKADNLTASAAALDLGTDSFVFVDDDPVERAQMVTRHPEVAVVEGDMPARRIGRLYFPRMRVTEEDRRKTAQYRDESRRRELAAALSFEDYLKGLEIRTEIHPVSACEYPRVAQLSQKANQFNVCTNRYTVGDVARLAGDPRHLLVSVRASDRFGDQGLIAFVHAAESVNAHVRGSQTSARSYEILDWVMSCRAMNRRIEDIVEQWVEAELLNRGAVEVRATWRKTAKNAPVRELFEKFGFDVVHAAEEEKQYAKVLSRRPGSAI